MRKPKDMTDKERVEDICAILADGIIRTFPKPKDDVKPRKRGRPKKEST